MFRAKCKLRELRCNSVYVSTAHAESKVVSHATPAVKGILRRESVKCGCYVASESAPGDDSEIVVANPAVFSSMRSSKIPGLRSL